MPFLARGGAHFVDLSGNQVIALTVLAPRGWDGELVHAEARWSQDVLTDPTRSRVVLRTQAPDLAALVLELDAKGIRIEHMFDY